MEISGAWESDHLVLIITLPLTDLEWIFLSPLPGGTMLLGGWKSDLGNQTAGVKCQLHRLPPQEVVTLGKSGQLSWLQFPNYKNENKKQKHTLKSSPKWIDEWIERWIDRNMIKQVSKILIVEQVRVVCGESETWHEWAEWEARPHDIESQWTERNQDAAIYASETKRYRMHEWKQQDPTQECRTWWWWWWGDPEKKVDAKSMCFFIRRPFGRRKALDLESNLKSNPVSATLVLWQQETFIWLSTRAPALEISTTTKASPMATMLPLWPLGHK